MRTVALTEHKNTEYAYFTAKELNASLHKVGAMILVNDAQTAEGREGDRLMQVTEAGAALAKSKVRHLLFAKCD